MPDRERDASRQGYNRGCSGRQLQPRLARCVRPAFLGTFDVKADDGIRTRDLRFTKPLLYQLSYVGATSPQTLHPPLVDTSALRREHERFADFPQRNTLWSLA